MYQASAWQNKIINQEKDPVRNKDNTSSGENFKNFQILFHGVQKGSELKISLENEVIEEEVKTLTK